MPPKPPSKDLEEVLHNIQERLAVIQIQLDENNNQQSTLEARNDHLHSNFPSLLYQVASLSHSKNKLSPVNHQTNPHSNQSHFQHQHPPPPTLKPPTVNLPFFDGNNPLDWLFQANQYFSFYQILRHQRVPMVAFHMQEEALSWFKWLHNNNLLTDWQSFTRFLELHFTPSAYTNHQNKVV